MKKLFLIDGMSLAFRAYHAMNETRLTNKNNEPTGAVYGFVNIITSFLEKEKPENIAVAFDCRQPTFRHKIFEQYKANRKEFPEDLAVQLPYIKNFLEFLGIPCIEKPGFEADDIIGTLAANASNNEVEVYCVTSDKDFFQLLNENVFILRNKKSSSELEVISKNDVKEKFGVEAHQVVDYLALIGDASDNVPGVKGIGEKTAIPLIEQFNDIETIYNKIDEIEKERTKKLLLESKDLAFLSKELVTIKTDVELGFEYNSLIKQETSFDELDELFQHLGFKHLREKWKNFSNNFSGDSSNENKSTVENSPTVENKSTVENSSTVENNSDTVNENNFDQIKAQHTKSNFEAVAQQNENKEKSPENLDNINTVEHQYILVDLQNINTMLADIANEPFLSVSIETDTDDKYSCEIVGIAFCNSKDKAYYLPLTSLMHRNENLFEATSMSSELITEYVIGDLQVILESPEIMKFGYRIKQTACILRRYGINISPIIFAPKLAAFLVSSANNWTFREMAEKYLSYTPMNLADFFKNKKGEFHSLSELSLEQKLNYFCEIVHCSYKLRDALSVKLNENNLAFVASSIEFPLIEVLVDMQTVGISIDGKKLHEVGIKVNEEIVQLKKFIYMETNEEFNIDSPKQLADILFNKMGLPTVKKNKTGFSTDLESLTELAEHHPVADLILNYRKLAKIKNTYIDALPKLINPQTNRIHTTFNQTIASTGRLSSTEPNLQNIPIRTELGKEIRSAFIAEADDFLLMSADYSQIELRIMAFLSNDANLIDAFKNNIDIHSATASLLFSCEVGDVTEDMRRTAKTVNFGIMYGLGSFGLSQRLRITRKAADEIIQNYFEKFHSIKTYISDTLSKVRELGYAETMIGRRRYFPDINHKNHNIRAAAERAAINMPIQGTASDMIKIAMLNIHQLLKQQNLRSQMILQIHDELLFEAAVDEIDLLADVVNTQMLYSLPLGEVPLSVSIGLGKTWLEAHS